MNMSSLNFALDLLYLLFNVIEIVQCLDSAGCSHSQLPSPGLKNEVILMLNCSSSPPQVSYTSYLEEKNSNEYSVIYTCLHPDGNISNGVVIDGRGLLTSPNVVLEEHIPCGSLCTFGGCYTFGDFGPPNFEIRRKSISPTHSCWVCQDDGCIPSLNLTSGLLIDEECPTTMLPPPTLTSLNPPESSAGSHNYPTNTSTLLVIPIPPCICNCTNVSGGYNCVCSPGLLGDEAFQCANIINCKLMMSEINVVDCDDSNCCFCNNHNCSVNAQIQRQYLFVTVLVLPLMLLLTCILLACFHITRRKAIRPADLIPDFEINYDDPIKIEAFKYSIYESGSTLTILDTINQSTACITSLEDSPPISVNGSNMDLSDHTADSEAYVTCVSSQTVKTV